MVAKPENLEEYATWECYGGEYECNTPVAYAVRYVSGVEGEFIDGKVEKLYETVEDVFYYCAEHYEEQKKYFTQ